MLMKLKTMAKNALLQGVVIVVSIMGSIFDGINEISARIFSSEED